ncbi:MAG: hypothetical protein ACW99J_16890 [Candidatus Thorarchaeota archaeon]|jgi:hypothetical protein
MVKTRYVIMLALAFVMVLGSLPNGVVAGNQDSGFTPSTPYQVWERDSFTYRVSFRLSDGTELFVIRSKFTILYFYHDGYPPANEFHMTASVGFYYGKTVLGRPIVADLSVEDLSFYPKWRDSAGIEHDLVMDIPMFRLNSSVFDGMRTGGMLLLDPDAVISYLPRFGGTFVLRGVTVTLDDGTELTMSDDTIRIVLDKHNNNLHADNATVYGNGGLSYTSDGEIATLAADGSAPFVVLLDLILAYSLIGMAGSATLLILLHVKGRIRLSLGPLRRITSSRAQSG